MKAICGIAVGVMLFGSAFVLAAEPDRDRAMNAASPLCGTARKGFVMAHTDACKAYPGASDRPHRAAAGQGYRRAPLLHFRRSATTPRVIWAKAADGALMAQPILST